MALHDYTEAKVDKFYHSSAFLDKNVVQLDVSMDDIVGVQISNRFGNLFENATRCGFSDDPICQRL